MTTMQAVDELAFEFDGMTKFVGLEIPQELLTQPEELRAGYLRALRRFNDRFAEICQRNRVERVLVDTIVRHGPRVVCDRGLVDVAPRRHAGQR